MKLSIAILSCLDNVFKASITANGLAAPASVNFNPRSGSTTSHIANLPKSLIDLGSATNITIPTVDLVVGATITRESVKGKSVQGVRSISGAGFIPRYGINDSGVFELFEVAPNGDRRVNLTVGDPAVAEAFRNAQKFLEYMDKLSAHAAAMKEYESEKSAIVNKQLTVKNALKGLKTDEEIDAIVSSMSFTKEAPVMPKFNAPETPETPETPEIQD